MKIELVRHPPQKYGDPDYFDRGERIIMVDGVRWGRTRVQSHGSRGTTTTFEQEGGETILDPSSKRADYINVRSENARHAKVHIPGKGYVLPADWKTTEQRTLEVAVDLVRDGLLRHPDVVKAEAEKRAAARRKARESAQERENAAFRNRAETALAPLETTRELYQELVTRVIDAMRWAQEQ
jgi:hypothetical protein